MGTAQTSERAGKIVTFYSYKGGTGRSMALANVAWVLASTGKRVLAIDWDLEAPGLHRYFEPFLADKTLERSTGVIDFVRDFTTAAVAGARTRSLDSVAGGKTSNPDSVAGDRISSPDWYEDYSNILAHAVPVEWDFPAGGLLHLVPAGKQDAAYAIRVNSFDWQDFYERLGGGVLLESVKQQIRGVYDVILIDSRTGVSDTSGVCSIQMPDEIVVCFTLNRQSIYGASSAARSAFKQRHSASGDPTLKIWPVPTRVEGFEKDRLELASNLARARFSGLMHQLSPEAEEKYWGEISINYEPYYAYEEVLSAFRDRPRQTSSMLARMETLATWLNCEPLKRTESIDEVRRSEGLASFTARSAFDFEQELVWLGDEYESIRRRMAAGSGRTELMSLLTGRAQVLASQRDAGTMAEKLFSRGTDGGRVIGLALARIDPRRQHIELALPGITESRSAFEQYHALLLADRLLQLLHPTAAVRLRDAIEQEIDKTIERSDPSRWAVAQRLLKKLQTVGDSRSHTKPTAQGHALAGNSQMMAEMTPSTPQVRYQDVEETHGLWVSSRGSHSVRLPSIIRIGQFLVTNSLYREFIRHDGYGNEKIWELGRSARKRFLTLDGTSMGPAHWPNSDTMPKGKEEHPVTSISYLEALAFVGWCNEFGDREPGWRWSLPPEDHWEFAARSEQGLIYPWGDTFDTARCNSLEGEIRDTTEVGHFKDGVSTAGCHDMAGNVWEFVLAEGPDNGSCVLRGGSFENNRFVVRSYLRLFGVPLTHRPADFGFRLAQVRTET